MYAELKTSPNWLMKRAINHGVRARLHELDGLVVDLGCGCRPFETDICEYADVYLGIDWSNSFHELSADVIADLNMPLPLRSSSIDHVVSFEVLEHLCEPSVMLAEAFRVLKPGGSITLSTPFQWWEHETPWDFYRYTSFGLEYLLKKAGFTQIVVTPTTGFWSMWILKLNYQMSRLIRGPKLIKLLAQAILIPLWWGNQNVARLMDSIWEEDKETAGYFAHAIKS